MDEDIGDELIVATVATGMNDGEEDTIVDIEPSQTAVPDQVDEDSTQSIELEVRQVSQDSPASSEDYPDFEEDSTPNVASDDLEIEKLEETNSPEDDATVENLPEPEDWENDDVPLFKSDRLDHSDDDDDINSQMEIPAFLRKKQ
jgi:hypothetical protein